jgi:hypothetical protein
MRLPHCFLHMASTACRSTRSSASRRGRRCRSGRDETVRVVRSIKAARIDPVGTRAGQERVKPLAHTLTADRKDRAGIAVHGFCNGGIGVARATFPVVGAAQDTRVRPHPGRGNPLSTSPATEHIRLGHDTMICVGHGGDSCATRQRASPHSGCPWAIHA